VEEGNAGEETENTPEQVYAAGEGGRCAGAVGWDGEWFKFKDRLHF